MRPAHSGVFFDVAQELTCWIGVREPNALSEKWIGRPRHVPKPMSCKAKSADALQHPMSGLVVDPTLCPAAFAPSSLNAAQTAWLQWGAPPRSLPPGFTVIESGPEHGLVKLNGAAIHADYDLMALVFSGEGGGFEETTRGEQQALFTLAKPKLNQGLGVPMIQHGPEMDYLGVGARASEFVLWFGPDRGFQRSPSSMPGPHGPGGGH